MTSSNGEQSRAGCASASPDIRSKPHCALASSHGLRRPRGLCAAAVGADDADEEAVVGGNGPVAGPHVPLLVLSAPGVGGSGGAYLLRSWGVLKFI